MVVAARISGVILAVAACTTSPVVTSPGPSHGLDASAGPSVDAGVAIPRILILSTDGTLSIYDPQQPAPQLPRRLIVPPGRWNLTSGPASVALTSLDPAGSRTILLGTIPDAAFVGDEQITLPAGDPWQGGYAACLSGAGPILAADAGLALWLIAPGEAPVKLPNQGNNTGGCAWLDDSRVVWEQENDRLATFDLEAAKTSELPATDIVGDPSGGRGRIAGRTAQDGLDVRAYTLDGSSVKIGPSVGRIDPEVGGSLSADGRWLVTAGPDPLARVYRVDETSLTAFGSFGIGADDRVEWMPLPGP
ncbi:MAG TPA: hypothetical protein VHM48_04045 [Candidatus Limnocylindrales bacterium]|nr:hypothetical protein [Candidatus Limnocylindrales bacterium]